MVEYYRINSRRITFREYWRFARNPLVLIWWIAKVLCLRIKLGEGFLKYESVKELEVTESDFSPEARARLQPLVEECQRLGFHTPRYYVEEDLHGDVRVSYLAMLHESGAFTLRLRHHLTQNVPRPKR